MPKKILIELPTWLGDCVMATPAIENIVRQYPDAQIIFVGSYVAVEAMKKHPNCLATYLLPKSYYGLFKIARSLGRFDMAFSFRSSFRSKIFLWLMGAVQKFQYQKNKRITRHQVLRYNDFICHALGVHLDAGDLKLYQTPTHFAKPTLGLNPGATYGSAKRWYPQEFAKVAKALSAKFDMMIFGGKGEQTIAGEIQNGIDLPNVTNLAGQTDIQTLISHIAGLSLFITNDSGPMHIAAAYKIPTVAIFGPTKSDETNQWNNPHGAIVKKELSCAPCMKRTCPLKHHACMKEITAEDALKKVTLLD